MPRPMKATGRSFAASVNPHLLEDLLGDAEAVHRRGHAAIGADLQEYLLQLVLADAVVDGAANVQLQLVRPVERGDHAEVEDRSRPPVEAGPVPGPIPAPFGRELLHGPGEIVRLLQRAIDIFGA